MDHLGIVYVLCFISTISNVVLGQSIFNVVDYGAVGDGRTNDTIAIVKAWNLTCTQGGQATMVIPKGKTFLLYPTIFQGPCKSTNIKVLLSGTIVAPDDPNYWKSNGYYLGGWLEFRYVDNVVITGGGTLDGRGKSWWDISCRYTHDKPGCNTLAPLILGIGFSKNVELNGIHTVNSGGVHIGMFKVENLKFVSLNLLAPEESPNTDGIRISEAHNISISDSTIATGDDCVGILDHVYDLNINRITCGPGHGISIGSLGANQEIVEVHDIHVSHINFKKTSNGARIKTHQAGRGGIYNIDFVNITMTDVDNPIIIDQHYGDNYGPPKAINGVHISEVTYDGIYGTSTKEAAISFNCSEKVACTGISLKNIDLSYTKSSSQTVASCNNAYGSSTGTVHPSSCLKSK